MMQNARNLLHEQNAVPLAVHGGVPQVILENAATTTTTTTTTTNITLSYVERLEPGGQLGAGKVLPGQLPKGDFCALYLQSQLSIIS